MAYTEMAPQDHPADGRTPIDVWLRFGEYGYEDCDDIAESEANTFRTENGYVVEWYHTAVGQVSRRHFDTYQDAANWLEYEGFQDFTS